MDARERFKHALSATAHAELIRTGWDAHIFDEAQKRARDESRASETDARRALREMAGLVVDEVSHYKATPFLALRYEETERAIAYAENEVRRRVLGTIIDVDEGGGWVRFGPDDETETQIPAARLRAAARVLAALGLIELGSESSGFFHCSVTPRGLQVYEDPAQLETQLPMTPTHDEIALLPVAPDALSDVIWSCKQLLKQRGWDTAMSELEAGDREYADGNWVNAVREYYRALESGLKYALTDAGATYDEGAALKRLATRAAETGSIPPNYQAFFGFADSIRSPRSHGAGPTPVEVEVGQHEALLMGNYVRAALLYLGGRRISGSSTGI
jgi:hypothetical protein